MKKKTVVAGQKWQDWDIRFRNHPPRILKVIKINATPAFVESDKHVKSRIRLDRFKPSSNGYKLLESKP